MTVPKGFLHSLCDLQNHVKSCKIKVASKIANCKPVRDELSEVFSELQDLDKFIDIVRSKL